MCGRNFLFHPNKEVARIFRSLLLLPDTYFLCTEIGTHWACIWAMVMSCRIIFLLQKNKSRSGKCVKEVSKVIPQSQKSLWQSGWCHQPPGSDASCVAICLPRLFGSDQMFHEFNVFFFRAPVFFWPCQSCTSRLSTCRAMVYSRPFFVFLEC